jgi:hypothetical protein
MTATPSAPLAANADPIRCTSAWRTGTGAAWRWPSRTPTGAASSAKTPRCACSKGEIVEAFRADVAERAAEAPTDPDDFIVWFDTLEQTAPGQNDPLFPWLAERAPMEAMRWFVEQEVAGEAGFDDLVAMTQVKMPTAAKLEMARITGTRWAAAARAACTVRCWTGWRRR